MADRAADAPLATDFARPLIVTCALPYANGSIHLGHMLESIQADIWVRFQRLNGRQVIFLCADDAHGTAIMLKAEEQGITPEQLVESVLPEHRRDFAGFGISFDNYYSTHSPENRELCNRIYDGLKRADVLGTDKREQLFDPARQLFLADRMVRGTCPSCAAPNQYGDVCERCGATYEAVDLVDPCSSLSGEVPSVRTAENLSLRLSLLEKPLRKWLADAKLQPAVLAKLDEWLSTGLKDWIITRPAPYFGFEVPDQPDKYFYVWVDAPVGYIASLKNWLDRTGEALEDWWNEGTEICHFIGKDIIYFHALFWPAMLHAADMSLPTSVFVHGFLTLNGDKMSKSRGTLVEASRYLQLLPPDPLRYYLAARLGAGVEDIDLDLDDFVQRVNSDLVGKYVNLASRTARFIEQGFAGRLPAPDPDSPLAQVQAAADEIAGLYLRREYRAAMRRIMDLADLGNRYVQQVKPWELARADTADPALGRCCSAALAIFRVLTIYLKPCVPDLAERSEKLLGGADLCWQNLLDEVEGLQLAPFEPLMPRLERDRVQQLIDETGQ